MVVESGACYGEVCSRQLFREYRWTGFDFDPGEQSGDEPQWLAHCGAGVAAEAIVPEAF